MPPGFKRFGRGSIFSTILVIFFAMLEGLFTTLPYGWASLVVVLKAEGFYSDLCEKASLEGVYNTTPESDTFLDVTNSSSPFSNKIPFKYPQCSAQDEKLNLIFTISSFLTLSGCLPTGAFYDYLGPRKTRIVCSCLFSCSLLMCSLSSRERPELLFPATAIMGTVGSPILVSLFEVANSFPKWRYTLVSALNGACMVSSTIFLTVQKAYELGLSMQVQFIFLLVIFVILSTFNTIFTVPKEKVPWPPEPNRQLIRKKYSYYPELGKEECQRIKEYDLHKKDFHLSLYCLAYHYQTKNSQSESSDTTTTLVYNHSDKKPIFIKKPVAYMHDYFKNIASPMFLWLLLWSSLMTFREFYFIGTLNPFLNYITKGDNILVESYTAIYGYITIGIILIAPLVGVVMDSNHDTPLFSTITAILITTMQAVLYSSTILVPIIQFQILTFVLVTIQRGFIHGVISSFLGIAFPQKHYGKFYGTVYLVCGIGTLLQSPIFKLTQTLPNKDPFLVNLGILIVMLIAHACPLYVWIHLDKKMKNKLHNLEEQTRNQHEAEYNLSNGIVIPLTK